MPIQVARLEIFPCKSLDGVRVERAALTPGGALEFDRRWAIFDRHGNCVNAKRYPAIQAIRASFDLTQSTVQLSAPGMTTGQWAMTDLDLGRWLSEYFQQTVIIGQNISTGFPDDLTSPGPTIISTETLAEISNWYPDLSIRASAQASAIDELRRRFRTNIEIAGGTAFGEDLLFTNSPHPFKLGEIEFLGINPCQRCIVPTRDSQTGQPDPGFQKTFTQQRSITIPPAVDKTPFNHFYRLAVNTRIPHPQFGQAIEVGDLLHI
jgi:uncharacterized protein